MPDGKPCTGCATTPRYVEATTHDELIGADDKRWTITHRINSNEVGRDLRVYRIADLEKWTRNYLRNPVVLHAHGVDPVRGTVPIGTNLSIRQVADGIEVETRFAGDVPEDSFSRMLYGLHATKVLRAWSTGTRDAMTEEEPLPDDYATANGLRGLRVFMTVVMGGELHEYSSVGIPADPGALNRMARAVADADGPRVVSYPTLESGLRAVVAMLRDAKGLPRSGNEIVPAVRELIAQTRETIAAVIADPPCQGCIDRQRAIVAQSGELAIIHAALVGMVKQNGAN